MANRYKPKRYDSTDGSEDASHEESLDTADHVMRQFEISYQSTGATLGHVKTALNGLLSSSPKLLHSPNNKSNYSIEFPSKNTQFRELSREGFQKYVTPLILVEAGNDLSVEFNESKVFRRDIFALPESQKHVQDDLFEIQMFCKMSFDTLNDYVYKFSNCIWILQKKNEFSLLDIHLNEQYIEDSVVLSFVHTFKQSFEDDLSQDSLPVWPDKNGNFPNDYEQLKTVTFKATYSNTEKNKKKMESFKSSDKLQLIFVGKISMFLRAHRMIGLPTLPSNVDRSKDPNLSSLYDDMIDPTLFNRHWNILTGITPGIAFDMLTKVDSDLVLIFAGGPGTSKTTSWLNYIVDYFTTSIKSNKRVKILICAPSNANADKLYLKIEALLPTAILCRVGKQERFDRAVSESSRQTLELVGRNHKLTGFQYKRKMLLKDAHFIITTIGSSQQPELTNYRKELNIDMIIIEDAHSARITELILPLHFTSATKLILVGDPNSNTLNFSSPLVEALPKVSTNMFKRIFMTLKDGIKNAIVSFDEQTRMRPLLMDLYNTIVYKETYKLKIGNIKKWRKTVDHPPLLTFSGHSWKETKATNSNSYENEAEANFCLELLMISLKIAGYDHIAGQFEDNRDPIKYAIICTYEAQATLYNNMVYLRGLSNVVCVKTFETAQDIEVDIAIISAVRTSTNDPLLFGRNTRNLSSVLCRSACVYVLAKINTFFYWPEWIELFRFTANRGLHYSTADKLKTMSTLEHILKKHVIEETIN